MQTQPMTQQNTNGGRLDLESPRLRAGSDITVSDEEISNSNEIQQMDHIKDQPSPFQLSKESRTRIFNSFYTFMTNTVTLLKKIKVD